MAERVETAEVDDPTFRALADARALGMAFQILAAPDGLSRRFTYVAPSCEALNGVPADAVLADPEVLFDLFSADQRRRAADVARRAHATLSVFDIEIPMTLPSGEPRWRRFTAAPRRLPDGSTIWDGIEIDTTARKAAELELEEQKRRLELAVEATDLGFWEWDLRRNTLAWSDRNKVVIGLPPEAPVSIETFMSIVHPDDRETVRDAYRAARDKPGGGDFRYMHRVVLPKGQMRWILARGRVLTDADGPRLVVGTNLDVTERRAEEERRTLVMGELAHRAKNGLAVILAIVAQSARDVSTVEAYQALLTARLQALASSQDLVTAAGGRPLQLSALIARGLEPFDLARFDIDPGLGEVMLSGETALGLALLVHELATNAVKYGALSRPGGRVELRRRKAERDEALVFWRERGGPPVKAPEKIGFGSRVLKYALRERGGRVDWRFEPKGFMAEIRFPAA